MTDDTEVKDLFFITILFIIQCVLNGVGLVVMWVYELPSKFIPSILAEVIPYWLIITGSLAWLFVGPMLATCYNNASPEANSNRYYKLKHYMSRSIIPNNYTLLAALIVANGHYFKQDSYIFLLTIVIVTVALLFAYFKFRPGHDKSDIVYEARDIAILSCTFSSLSASIITTNGTMILSTLFLGNSVERLIPKGCATILFFLFVWCFVRSLDKLDYIEKKTEDQKKQVETPKKEDMLFVF